MVTQKFVRKPFTVDAVQVTADNMGKIAEWCGGSLKETKKDGSAFIEVDVIRPQKQRHTRAFPGDWVVRSEQGFKVYTEKAFEQGFNGWESNQNVFDGDALSTDTVAEGQETLNIFDNSLA